MQRMEGVPQLASGALSMLFKVQVNYLIPRDHMEKDLLQKEGQPPKGCWENGLRKALEV